jgi:hypothetical protein
MRTYHFIYCHKESETFAVPSHILSSINVQICRSEFHANQKWHVGRTDKNPFAPLTDDHVDLLRAESKSDKKYIQVRIEIHLRP